MTEKEMIVAILERIKQPVCYQNFDHIEFENAGSYEQICIDFDNNGNVVKIYS